MTYFINHIIEYRRLMFGVISDSRQNIPAIKNQYGAVMKAYVDTQTSLVIDGVLTYAIRTLNGNLAGYFGIQVKNGPVYIVFQQLRPAFIADSVAISKEISTFIASGNWRFNIL